MEEKYASWKIDSQAMRAYLNPIEGPFVPLQAGSGNVKFTGRWGKVNGAKNLLSGICLFPGSWIIEFAPQHRNPPGRMTLASPMERERAYKKLAKGQAVRAIYYPIEPSAYHRQLISWQAEIFSSLQADLLLYHLPRLEYHHYISELEERLGEKLPRLHEGLEIFSANLQDLLFQTFAARGLGRSNIQVIEPMAKGAKAPSDSYLLPYLCPEKFGAEKHDLTAVEDLPELKLSWLAEEKIGHRIPVIVGVLAMPHPFFDKAANNEQAVRMISLG